MENSENLVLLVEGGGALIINPEKRVLVEELIKHFKERWKAKADKMAKAGESYNVLGDIQYTLNKIQVEHQVAPVLTVNIFDETTPENISRDAEERRDTSATPDIPANEEVNFGTSEDEDENEP